MLGPPVREPERMSATEPNRFGSPKTTSWVTARARRFRRDLRWLEVLQFALFVAFAATKLASPWDKYPRYTGDGRIWAYVAEAPLLSRDFWFSTRPPTMALFYKLLDMSDDRMIWLHSFLAIAAWGLLASSVARLATRTWVALLSFVGVLGVALTSTVHGWDIVIRTESLSSSLIALVLACTLRFLALTPDHRRRRLIWLLCGAVSAFLAAFVRDTNAYILLLLAIGLPIAQWLALGRVASGPLLTRAWARLRRQGVLPLLFSAVLILPSMAAQHSVRQSERYFFPLMNTIFRRVLPSKWKRQYFQDELGMPVSRTLMSRRYKWASSNRRVAFKHEAYADFRSWLRQNGLPGYQRYLIENYEVTLAEAYRFYPRMVRARLARTTRPSANPATDLADGLLLSGPISAHPVGAHVFVSAIGLVALIGARRRKTRLLALFTVLCAGLTASQAFICYHGDAMEVERHALPVGMLLRLGVVAAIALCFVAVHAAIARGASAVWRRTQSRALGRHPHSLPGVPT